MPNQPLQATAKGGPRLSASAFGECVPATFVFCGLLLAFIVC